MATLITVTTQSLRNDGVNIKLSESNLEKKSNASVKTDVRDTRLLFPVDSNPPWALTVLYALQILSTLSGPVTAAFVIRSLLCAPNDQQFLTQLISVNLFMAGLCTVLQVSLGVRLPVIQASSFAYLPIIASMMMTPEWRCPEASVTHLNDSFEEITNSTIHQEGDAENLWQPRIMEVSGALIAASGVQVLIGCCGLVGFMMRFIGPLTIAPTIALIGLSISGAAIRMCEHHWGVAIFTTTIFLAVLSFMKNIQVPFPKWSKARGCHSEKFPIFRLFPQAIAISLGWTFCFILTVSNALPDIPTERGYLARTDTSLDMIAQNNWFFLPYPGMWGWPTISLATWVGMLSATITSTLESVGDYYATARACNVPPPPKHAVNRGIAMEGFGSVICGLLGAGHATTSYSQTVGFITLTGMASRVTWLVAGCLLMVAGVFGKFAAILSIIPEPVLGGVMLIGLGMVVAVGISTLQYVDLASGRNQVILGVALLMGLAIPTWIKENPDIINTGSRNLNEILTMFLSTAMFVGGSLAFILDNILPGTMDERGFVKFNTAHVTSDNEDSSGVHIAELYNLPKPFCCKPTSSSDDVTVKSGAVRRFLTYLPFVPCYVDRSLKCPCGSKRRTLATDGNVPSVAVAFQ